MPHSRHTEIRRDDIVAKNELTLLAESEDSGVSIVMARNGREFFITGHFEYAPNTLDIEYKRDLGKRDDVEMPLNYYRNNNPDNPPLVTWRAMQTFCSAIGSIITYIRKRHTILIKSNNTRHE